MNLFQAEQEAIAMGATHKLTYHTQGQFSFMTGRSKLEFSRHYFNEDGEEIAYVINDTVNLLGLTKLKTPRVWSEEFLQNPDYILTKFDQDICSVP